MRADRLLIGAFLTTTLTATGAAQQGPAFEAVSIKRNTSNPPGASIGVQPGGRFVMVNMDVRALVGSAYPTDTSEFVNAPSWIFSERYDITAVAPAGTTQADMEPMLRTLLAERFNFKGHYETRDQPIYELVRARPGERLPPGLKKIDADCDARRAAMIRGEKPPDLPPLDNGRPPCGMGFSGGQLTSNGMTMAALGGSIQGATGRMIVDRTGLDGYYAFTLSFTSSPRPDSDVPSIFTALEEQLGLKLQSARGPVRVLVIDAIDRPTDN